MVPRLRPGETGEAETLILNAINLKRVKGGMAYAKGKTLIVFLEAGSGVWYPEKVAKRLPDPLQFATVWVVGLHAVEDGDYVYGVTNLDMTGGNVPVLLVRISSDFEAWQVKKIQ